ncbi:MAG TPA: methylenetetrahydrofolate--tRNA-(uracil(54)-C(5))-methyltransferase (FADH(2)-oxidizing) TrmFO [Byssovorax sp.]
MAAITVVGGGLAGCEAAFQLAERGHDVTLLEMKPEKRTPAQTSDHLAELVCSNSLRGAALSNAVGLLKEELRRAGSLVLRVADATKVPAGGALAVDRERFGVEMTRAVSTHARIRRVATEVTSIPSERPVILATGPLTGDALAADLARAVGAEHLAYYDAIAPIVTAESIAWDRVFKQSRWGKGADPSDGERGTAEDAGDAAYVNCPFDKPGYEAFVAALVEAEKVPARAFEETRYFEGCLPCEVMAERGPDTLRFGPMKPVGLTDPKTGRRPWAVVQLRQEDAGATAYNLVGFQTRMKYGPQERVFRMIPGLEEAEFLRLGSVHRNTFVDAPRLLDGEMQLKAVPGVYLAGQVSGVEGYVESAAGGFLCALMLAERLAGREPTPPPKTTALGGLMTHLARGQTDGARYQPSNVTWAHVPPLEGTGARLKKRERYQALAARGLVDFEAWRASLGLVGYASPDEPVADAG